MKAIKKKIYSTWIPYKECKKKFEEQDKEEKNEDESDDDNE